MQSVTDDHTFVMIDAYGDGWNGASVDLLVDGVNIATLSAADSDLPMLCYENFLFAADEGSSISLSNWVSGNWNERFPGKYLMVLA